MKTGPRKRYSELKKEYNKFLETRKSEHFKEWVKLDIEFANLLESNEKELAELRPLKKALQDGKVVSFCGIEIEKQDNGGE